MKKIQAMTSAECEKVLEDGKCVIEGHDIEKNEIRFIYYLDSENDDNSQLVERALFISQKSRLLSVIVTVLFC